jgi:hypothetical protein
MPCLFPFSRPPSLLSIFSGTSIYKPWASQQPVFLLRNVQKCIYILGSGSSCSVSISLSRSSTVLPCLCEHAQHKGDHTTMHCSSVPMFVSTSIYNEILPQFSHASTLYPFRFIHLSPRLSHTYKSRQIRQRCSGPAPSAQSSHSTCVTS